MVAIVALFLASGCSQGSKSNFDGEEDVIPPGFDTSAPGGGGGVGGLGDLGGGSGVDQPLPGSNSDGTFSALDQQAINSVLTENKQVDPTVDVSIFNEELKAQANEILRLQRQKQDTAAKKLLFMANMIKRCGELTAKYTPIPGQPLLGTWNGQGACTVSFEVAGAGSGGKYSVAGGTQGAMQADVQGKGAIQANPFSGNVIDSPQSGSGQLTHPTFFKTKNGTSPCSVNVSLKTPKSPIPQNYQTAVQIMGKCLRNTALLISPVFDRMFQDMNPQLAQLLQQKFLDIK